MPAHPGREFEMTNQSQVLLVVALTSITGLMSQADEPAPIDPAKWNAEIAAFAVRDAKTPPPKGVLLFVGSSTIRMWDLKTSWPGEEILNNGFGGSTLPDAIHHFEKLVAAYQPRAVVLYSGDNDLSRGRSVNQVLEDFKTFAALSRKAHPEVPVVILAIKPSLKRWSLWPEMREVNQAIEAHCAGDSGLVYADVATPLLGPDGSRPDESWFKADGLHLSPKGYARWTTVVGEALREAGMLD
jgi:lysophospholipase L1-like esterase